MTHIVSSVISLIDYTWSSLTTTTFKNKNLPSCLLFFLLAKSFGTFSKNFVRGKNWQNLFGLRSGNFCMGNSLKSFF